MKTKFVSLIVGPLFFMAVVPLSSQNAPAQDPEAVHARRSIAISLLRTINTVEVTYKYKHGGSYADWNALLTSEEFHADKYIAQLAKLHPEFQNVQFSQIPEILPGWSLRLNLTADGQAYDLLLEDKTDKACGYAAITDERGVIRQSKTIDCDI